LTIVCQQPPCAEGRVVRCYSALVTTEEELAEEYL